MEQVIQIVKVNDLKTGNKDGRTWEMQEAECILLKPDGSPDQVGVLSLPKHLRGVLKVGSYTGTFTLRPDLRTRRIEAALVELTPLARKPA